MNNQNIEQIHQNIIDIYEDKAPQKINYIKNKKTTDPIYNPKLFHNEERPSLEDINLEDIEILHDLLLVGNEIKDTALKYNQLMNKTRVDLFMIEQNINKALDYHKNIRVYSTKNIIDIEEGDCYGHFFNKDNSFLLPVEEESENKLSIKNIVGNGYEGNKYVIVNNKEERQTVDTSNRSNITNTNYYIPYEYSRINVYEDEELLNNNFNYGNTEAKCVMDIEFKELSSMMLITIYGEPVLIKSIETSNDGINYIPTEYPITEVRLDKVVHYPESKFIRLHLESTTNTGEIIGTMENDKDNNKILNIDKHQKDGLKIQQNGKRHRISISNIRSNNIKHLREGFVQTRELIEENETVETIAFDARIINNSKNDTIKFTFLINGKAIEVSPLSANDNKIKFIKDSLRTYEESKSIFIGEPIKSASLIIEMKGGGGTQSPVIEDIKILKY